MNPLECGTSSAVSRRTLRTLLVVGLLPGAAVGARASDGPCEAIRAAATRNDLPAGFLTRLIWQESRFDPSALSPAGAQGVAQFMPRTAIERGLLDPFEPNRAIQESAAYLSELRQTFGNLGLAAAAYNAGPGRLSRWISGKTPLPQETIDYVLTITGHTVFEWNALSPPAFVSETGFSCSTFLSDRRRFPSVHAFADPDDATSIPLRKPWTVVLAASFQQRGAHIEYETIRNNFSKILGNLQPTFVRRRIGGQTMMKYIVQIEQNDREISDRLCKRLETAGGACLVLRNATR